MNVLQTVFVIVAVLAVAFIVLYSRNLKLQRLEGERPPFERDLILYAVGILGIFAVVSLCVWLIPPYYQALGGREFLGGVDGSGFDSASLTTLLTILTGVPVALAGSVYAILLARRADETSTEQMEMDLEGRLAEMTQRMTDNYTRLGEALLATHATTTVLMERALRHCSEALQKDDIGAGIVDAIGQLDLTQLKTDIAELRNCVGAIRRHEPSVDALRLALEQKRTDLGANYFIEHGYKGLEKHAWLGYRNSNKAETLVDALEILRLQAERLTVQDLLTTVLEGALYKAADVAEAGKKVDARDRELFFHSFVRQPTRECEPHYYIRALGRMLLTRQAQLMRKLTHTWESRTINFGALILEDLYRLMPDKEVLMRAVMMQTLGQRIQKVNQRIVPEHLESLSYAGRGIFPAYFVQGAAASLDAKDDAEPALVLRVPGFANRIYDWAGDQLAFAYGNDTSSWECLVSDYVATRLIERGSHITRMGSTRATVHKAFSENGLLFSHLSPARRWETTRARTLGACAASQLEEAAALASAALQLALPGNEQRRSAWDAGDIATLRGDAEAAARHYASIPQGECPTSLSALSEWLDGFISKLHFDLTIQGSLIMPSEVAAKDGLLPMFVHRLPRLENLILRKNTKYLIDVALEVPPGWTFPTWLELANGFLKIFDSWTPDADKEEFSLDDFYREWHAWVSRREILPAAAAHTLTTTA